MTAAERQSRRRQRLRKAKAGQEAKAGKRRAYQPPHGYGKAKGHLLAAGHCFERARREFGFEGGTFIDGAFVGSDEVIALAAKPPLERKQWLAERRHDSKDFACDAVEGYMGALQVSRDELIQYLTRRDRRRP
jgi:hypothetical protein